MGLLLLVMDVGLLLCASKWRVRWVVLRMETGASKGLYGRAWP